jgi:tetratricopeptide (TPR) repeat protein
MRRSRHLAGLLLAAACTTPLEQGERLYREGDRLAALELWRQVPENAPYHDRARERIAEVESEFQRLVVQYKQRARYHEERDRLAESILDYRLALKLQPDDARTLDHVQRLARTLAGKKAQLKQAYREALDAGNLAGARRDLDRLRSLDPIDPELETAERQLHDALRAEVERLVAAGQKGFGTGNYDAAERAFRRVLTLDPDNESARGYISYIATIRRESERVGDPPAAFEAPAAFTSDSAIRAEGFYQNALAAQRRGDPFAAIRHDLRALQADPEHAAARRHLRLLRRELSPRVYELIEDGRRAFRDEDLESALELWRQALLVDPDNGRARAYIGRGERQLENLERLRAEPDAREGVD